MSTTLLRPLRPGGASDAQLARRAAAGDDDAFATLYARYQPRLKASCRTIVRHDEDARDAAQNAMTKALVAMRGATNALNVQAWLFRIAHNEAITVLRRRRPTTELSDGDGCCDHRLDPAGEVLLREELRATLAGVRALPPRLQQPLLLRELAGMSYREVADVTGGTSAAARKAVFEARSALTADRAGRDEECAVIRRALSAGDGRRRRARIVRSHLQACDGCRLWERDQRARRERLAALPAAAGAGAAGSFWAWLVGLLGGGAGTAAVGVSSLATNAKIAATAVVVVAAGAAAPVVEHERADRTTARAQSSAGARTTSAGTPVSTRAATPAATPTTSAAAPAASARRLAAAAAAARDRAAAATAARERTAAQAAEQRRADARERSSASRRRDAEDGRTAATPDAEPRFRDPQTVASAPVRDGFHDGKRSGTGTLDDRSATTEPSRAPDASPTIAPAPTDRRSRPGAALDGSTTAMRSYDGLHDAG